MDVTIKIKGKEYGLKSMGKRIENCHELCPLSDECRELQNFQPCFCEPLFEWSYYSYKTPRRFVLEEVKTTKNTRL